MAFYIIIKTVKYLFDFLLHQYFSRLCLTKDSNTNLSPFSEALVSKCIHCGKSYGI